jgi:hypothetical protein
MSQQEPRRANPQGFERATGAQDGSEHPELGDWGARGLGGGRAVRPKDLRSKDQKIQKVKLQGSQDERSKASYKDSRYQGLKESSLTLQGAH